MGETDLCQIITKVSVKLTLGQVPHFMVSKVRKSYHEDMSRKVTGEACVDISPEKEKAKWNRQRETASAKALRQAKA